MDCDNGLEVFSNDGVLDIIPPSEYDPFEAKFCASLFWLVFHATEDGGLEDVPSQVTSPIHQAGKNGFVVHPEIVRFLSKGEVYCTVCSRVFPGKVALAGHWSVIQTLSRNGVYVVDGSTDIAVTDSALEQTNPFNQGAHIALMDALMTGYSSQVVSIHAVVQAVRQFSTFSASRELPFDLEDALLLWVNKLSVAVNDKHVKLTSSSSRKLLHSREQERKVGIRVDNEESTSSAVLPMIDDLLKGLCDGRCLLGIVLFYEPNVITIEDICSMDDSIRNVDLFRSLCSQYFCTSVLALKVEDILYGSTSLKINIVAMLAEMFSKCERGAKQEQEIPRSKTSCSENGLQGEHNECAGNPRSHSAPGSRNKQFLDRDISLKIQNFVENVGSLEDVHTGGKLREREEKMATATTSLLTTIRPSEEQEEGNNMVEVDGVVVKLRKKVPRDIQPGGGHEALLSRRMKRSLFSSSQEDISNETPPITSDPEQHFDVKSSEDCEQHEFSEFSHEPESPEFPHEPQFSEHPHKPEFSEFPHETKPKMQSIPNGDIDNLDLTSMKDTPHSFNLDLGPFPDTVTPIDLLSPISETTEPGSLGNSLNLPTGDVLSEIRNQTEEKSKGIGHKDFEPPISRTPRKVDSENQSLPYESNIPRGSYVISSASHTAESAVAAGIPVVEHESQRNLGTSRSAQLSATERSSSDDILYRTYSPGNNSINGGGLSSITIDSSRENKTDTYEPAVVDDQRDNTKDHLSQRMNNNRFSTYTKDKKHDGKEYLVKHSQNSDNEKPGGKICGNIAEELDEIKKGNSDPPITWFVHRKDELGSQKDDVSQKAKFVGHVPQRTTLESCTRKTSWAMAEEDGKHSEPVKKDVSYSVDKL